MKNTIIKILKNHESVIYEEPDNIPSGNYNHLSDELVSSFTEFIEWVGLHYIRMNKVWCHKFRDQRDKDNWKTTQELYELFKKS